MQDYSGHQRRVTQHKIRLGRDADAGRRADLAALEAVVRGVAAPVPVAALKEGEKRRQGRCGLLRDAYAARWSAA